MELSVILICHNSAKDIRPCLDSLLTACTSYEKEILVVDNGSTDETIAQLKVYEPTIQIIRNNYNQGVAKARNQALRKAIGDYLWILDIDTVVNKEALDKMHHLYSNNSGIGICGCKLTDAEGFIQDSCRKLPLLSYKCLNLLESLTKKHKYLAGLHSCIEKRNETQFYHQEMDGQSPFEVEYLIGACQFLRRSLLEKVGFLDESIFYGPEDADFCLRIRKLGLSIMYIPYVSIIHHYNRSSNRKPLTKLSLLHAKGLLYFWWKNRILI